MASRRTFLWGAAALAAGCGSDPPKAKPRRSTTGSDAPTGDTGALTTDTGTTEPTAWSGQPGPEPATPWEPAGVLDLATFASGIQTGDATPTTVLVSVRQEGEQTLTMALARGLVDGWQEVLQLGELVPGDEVVQLEVTNLVPDTTYAIVFYSADGLRRSDAARFRTALYPDATRIVRFGATSCLGSFGSPWPCLSRVADQKLDFFLLLGDTIYADEGIRPAGDWDGHWRDQLRIKGLRDLTMSTSVLATWDDHEVDNDWTWDQPGMPDDALDALDAFRRSIPQPVHAVGSGMWRKLSWGAVLDVFVLDCRGERVGGNYISPEQMDWLKAELVASTARFKIVMNSVPITDMDDVYFGIAASDRWDGYAAQRTEILEHIRTTAVPGVLWVAGDFHWGAISSIGRPGDAHDDQIEVFCGPAGSPINPLGFAVPEGGHYEVVVTTHNAVTFEADADAGTIRIQFEGDAGPIVSRTFLA